MEKFLIEKNTFLSKEITGYYNTIFTGFKNEGNPDFINILKNTFNTEKCINLIEAQKEVIKRLEKDIPQIIEKENLNNCICINVPRAKIESKYSYSQLFFKDAVSRVNKKLQLIDGTNFIKRIKDTKTTHLKNVAKNEGPLPYVGITKDTCEIDRKNIEGNDIILIDDVYTKTVNIDEDCIQALLDNGARKVIFYSIGFTRRIK
nr:hypothetical protein [Fusobacterium gastrosuis]